MARLPKCLHTRAVTVRVEIAEEVNGVWVGHFRQTAVICRACGAFRHAPVFSDRFTNWQRPLTKRTKFPEGASMAAIAGPSEDIEALLRASTAEHERIAAERSRDGRA